MINLRTRAQKIRHALATQRLLDSLERSNSAIIEREFNRLAREAASASPAVNRVISAHESRLEKILTRMLLESARLFAKRYKDERGKACPWILEKKLDTEEELDNRIEKWAKRRAGEKIAPDIAQTSKRKIRKVITDGLGNNDPPDVIARAIREKITSLAVSRARTIARTETHAAAMTGEMEAVKADGLVETKEWVSSNDQRTRDDHADANGQTVKLNKSFTVGGESLEYPGDPSGPPEQVINCRCILVYGVGND